MPSGNPGHEPPTAQELTEHLAFVRRVAQALVHDPDLAEDLSQEAILAALRRPPQIERDLRSWLGGVVRNLARVHYREKARRTRRERTVAETRHSEAHRTEDQERDAVAESLGRAELRQRIAEAVLSLDDPYRTVLVLRYMENLSPTEIANLTGRPVATIKTQLQRGLDRLRTRFDAEPGGREAWRRAFLGLLLPLPILLASSGVAAAATGAATLSDGSGVSTSRAGSGTRSGTRSGAGAGVGAGASGVLLGSAAWVPIAALLALTSWWVLPGGSESADRRAPVVREAAHSAESAIPEDDSSKTFGSVAPPPESSLRSEPTGGLPTSGLAVRVVDEQGEGVAGARFTPVGPTAISPGASIRTDAAGFAQLPSQGAATIRVTHPDFLDRTLSLETLFHASLSHETLSHETLSRPASRHDASPPGAPEGTVTKIVLFSGSIATIEVIDERTGRGIAGATIAVEPEREGRGRWGVGWGEAGDVVSSFDFADSSLSTTRGTAHTWSLGSAEEGRDLVADERLLATIASEVLERDAEIRTDNFGRAQLRIDPDLLYSIDVSAPEYGAIERSAIDLSASPVTTVTLAPEARLRLVREDGELPARRFEVSIGGSRTRFEFLEGETELVIGELPAGAGYLRETPGSFLSHVLVTRLEDQFESHVVLISTEPPNSRIEIHTVQPDPRGEARSREGPSSRQDSGSTEDSSSSKDSLVYQWGSELTAKDAQSPYGRTAWIAPPTLALPITLTSGEETVVDLDAPGPATLEVVVTPRAAIEAARARVVDEAGVTIGRGETTDRGFTVSELPLGTWRLLVESDTGTLAGLAIEVTSGRNSIDLALPTGSVAIESLDPGAAVTLVHAEDLARRHGRANEEGRLTFLAIPPGEVLLSVPQATESGERSLATTTITVGSEALHLDWSPEPPLSARLHFRGAPPTVHRAVAEIRPVIGSGILSGNHAETEGGTRSANPPPGVRIPLEFDRHGNAYPSLALSPGLYSAEVQRAGGLAEVTSFEVAPLRSIEIELRPMVTVRIRAREGGAPLSRRPLTLESADSGLRGSTTLRLDPRGEITAELPAGRYRVTCGETTHTIEVGPRSSNFELSY